MGKLSIGILLSSMRFYVEFDLLTSELHLNIFYRASAFFLNLRQIQELRKLCLFEGLIQNTKIGITVHPLAKSLFNKRLYLKIIHLKSEQEISQCGLRNWSFIEL